LGLLVLPAGGGLQLGDGGEQFFHHRLRIAAEPIPAADTKPETEPRAASVGPGSPAGS
jgi:hypothetical protein